MTKSNKILLYAYEMGYRCDSEGEVFSKKRKLDPYSDKSGYLKFSVVIHPPLHHKKTPRAVPVHRLQAYQKYGEKIFEKNIHVRHLNSDRRDNSEENIGIGSRSDNMMDKPKDLRMKLALNASSHNRKFTDQEMNDIKLFYNESKSYKKTIEKFNISGKGTLHYMLNKKYITTKQ